jgi:hypothetical protein
MREMSVSEQRYNAVRAVISEGRTLTQWHTRTTDVADGVGDPSPPIGSEYLLARSRD